MPQNFEKRSPISLKWDYVCLLSHCYNVCNPLPPHVVVKIVLEVLECYKDIHVKAYDITQTRR